MRVKIQKNTALAAIALGAGGVLAYKAGLFSNMKMPNLSRAFVGINPAIPDFAINLAGSKPLARQGNSLEILATADNSPVLFVPNSQILNRWAISVGITRLDTGAVREPHWHTNASEIAYLLDGQLAFTIFEGAPASFRQSFTLSPGEVVFVPNGLLHGFENIGNTPATLLAAWNNERPQTIGLSGFVGSTPKDLLERSMGMRGSGFFNNFNNNSGMDVVFGQKAPNAIGPSVITGITQNIPGQGGMLIGTKVGEISTVSPFKYSIEQAQPTVKTQAGMTIMADSIHFPALKGQGQACFSITLRPGGSREPHWHQFCGELHFVHTGQTRYLVLAPGGQSELGNLQPGEFFYAPPGYAHLFENIGNTDLHVVSFFSNDNPGDIGLTGIISSFSNAVLGAVFNKNPDIFNQMKRYDQDQGIVGSPGSVQAPGNRGQLGFGASSG